MPSTVSRDLARKLDRMGTELAQSRKRSLNDAGMALKNAVEASRAKVAPSGRLRGVGRSGAALKVRFDVDGDRSVTVKASGPWQLVEENTKAHRIEPKKRRGKKAILTPAGPRAGADHPGTRGRKPFKNGVEDGKPKALRVVRDASVTAVRRGISA